MGFAELSIMVTGAAGVLGWYVAWRSRGETIETRKALEVAHASEASARGVALEASARAATAEALHAGQKSRAEALEAELASERMARQTLVDALAKAGLAVGDVVVDAAIGRLYPNDGARGSGAAAGSGGDPVGVSGQPAGSAGTGSRR